MTSPFDDDAATYLVLTTADGAFCLWPAWSDVPSGWTVAHGPSERQDCLGWIEAAVNRAARCRPARSA